MTALVTYKKILDLYTSKQAGRKALLPVKNLLPLVPSERLAGIVGDLFSDGHLQGPNKWRLDFTSASLLELKRFEKEFYLQFGVKGKVRPCVTNKFGTTYNYGINNKPLSRILFLYGVPVGNKVLQPTKIPQWILSNAILFKRFIQRVLDCEGCVDTSDKSIVLTVTKSTNFLEENTRFLNDIKEKLYTYYNITTTNPFLLNKINVRKNGIKTQEMRLKIKRQESIIKFHKCMKFETKSKQEKLDKIANIVMGR